MQAIEDMNIRGQKMSAKWANELLLGMNDDNDQESDTLLYINAASVPMKERNVIHYANLLLSNGEYQRCAHMMRNKIMINPEKSIISIYLSYYSLYMAGEKLKDQSISENQNTIIVTSKDGVKSTTVQSTPHINPYLNDIFKDLLVIYNNGEMDAHLLYLFGIVVRDVRAQGIPISYKEMSAIPPYCDILYESLSQYPLNW
jgi:hypothetical protein